MLLFFFPLLFCLGLVFRLYLKFPLLLGLGLRPVLYMLWQIQQLSQAKDGVQIGQLLDKAGLNGVNGLDERVVVRHAGECVTLFGKDADKRLIGVRQPQTTLCVKGSVQDDLLRFQGILVHQLVLLPCQEDDSGGLGKGKSDRVRGRVQRHAADNGISRVGIGRLEEEKKKRPGA